MKDVLKSVAEETLDKTKWIKEKKMADSIGFGVAKVVLLNGYDPVKDPFTIKGSLKTVNEWYAKWLGVLERDQRYNGTVWRQKNNTFGTSSRHSYLKKLGEGIKKISEMEDRNIEDVIKELEKQYAVNNKDRSLKKFVYSYPKFGKSYYKSNNKKSNKKK